MLFLLSNNLLGQTWSNYTTDNSGLPSNYVTSITIVEETIWVTTDKGLASFDGNNWETYFTEDGISSKIINSSILEKDSANTLWLGSNKGTINFNVEDLFITAGIKYWSKNTLNILSDTITSIGIDSDFYKWLGTDKGVSIITPSEVLSLSIGSPGIKLKGNQINSFSISSDTVFHRNENYIPSGGVMYVATDGGGISRFYNHEIDGISSASIVQSTWSGLPSDTVLTVFIDKQNNHWYGTVNGVASHFEHDSKNADWNIFTTEDGLVDNRVTSISGDSNGMMWFGTIRGVSSFDGNNWKSYAETDGVISNNILDIKIDSKNNIWIATDKGLSKLSELPLSMESHSKNTVKEILSLKTYPNPFNLSVNFTFALSNSTKVNFQIYNTIGELIKEIVGSSYAEGSHTINWNAHDNNNETVNSGIYLVRIQTPNMIVTKKIILLK